MEYSLMPYTTIYKSTVVTNIESKSDYCIVHATDALGNARRYIGKHVICAIPQSDLAALDQLDANQRTLINTVAPISLNRVYGEFSSCPKPWFANLPRTTTSDKLRQFIPINNATGVAMVSYSDTRYADFWKKKSDKGVDVLKKEVLKHLHAVFPDVSSIPKPEWIGSYYWPAGVHMWKPGANADAVIPQMQNIMSRVYIVGEAYCKIQGWIEGALESVEDVFKNENI
jgi:monoamine oxidase